MPTGLLSRIDDNEVFALIGNLANADDMEAGLCRQERKHSRI